MKLTDLRDIVELSRGTRSISFSDKKSFTVHLVDGTAFVVTKVMWWYNIKKIGTNQGLWHLPAAEVVRTLDWYATELNEELI